MRVYWAVFLAAVLSGPVRCAVVSLLFNTEPPGAAVWLEREKREPILLGHSGDEPLQKLEPANVQVVFHSRPGGAH